MKRAEYGKVKELLETYPDCGKNVRCDVIDPTTGKSYEASSIAKEEYDMRVFLNQLQKKYKIKNTEVDKMLDLMDKFGSRKYSEGSHSNFD